VGGIADKSLRSGGLTDPVEGWNADLRFAAGGGAARVEKNFVLVEADN
jgi:hypothetical protein